VEQVIGYPRFGLSKEGVWVKVEAWADDPEPVETLSDIWIKVTGLQSKWCEWNTLDQAVYVCGIMRDVDWLSAFKNNAQEVRVKISYRDPSKIPSGRLFEFHKNLFILGFTAESLLPANDDNDLLGEDLEDHNRRNGGDGNGDNGDRGVDNGGRSDAPPNSSLGGAGAAN
jgi:hypothetical protein